ncbi:alpha-1,6-glucosidase domain-containing protein [Pseudoxanthomonas putridarboris]|uniref:Alpha-1,6-glucosidase domain-containing protein n=1 Tax=Pseudoxanthomonas putridarboris TaxID=752605 RepID=A0ABU9J0M7_9GAMM
MEGFHRHRKRWLAMGIVSMLLPCSPLAHAKATLADCDAAAFATTLQPSASATVDATAQAYWLSADRIRWPGTSPQGRYRLYHSAVAALVAQPGRSVVGADGHLVLESATTAPGDGIAQRFGFVPAGADLRLGAQDRKRLADLLRQQIVLVREDASGRVLAATAVQHPGALDDLYAAAVQAPSLGPLRTSEASSLALWAPTARAVSLCLYSDDNGGATEVHALSPEAATGIWHWRTPGDLSGRYYTYLVDVHVPGTGVVRNRVTDPYSISLGTDSRRSYFADPDSPALKPAGWDDAPRPDRVKTQTDMTIYELHVRDFSIGDASVPAAHRGKYLAFTDTASDGMRHLRALSEAGMTDVHLLPVFDIATIPEAGCLTPRVPDAAADSEAQQAAVMAVAARDCFNWGYDPFHFNAPEGSYASDASDGARRIAEFRRMVMALNAIGLRVGMDVVYNHTAASGQAAGSVLDRIVPGYYQRLDGNGRVERSTCCDNTATEHAMMARLMIDSAVLWARHYRIDSFRFDLMGHQPRAAMEELKRRVDAATGRDVQLIGEGWNFGEVADGARFVQASQLSLNGSGIGTFSDRTRDALRGGGPADGGDALVKEQGWLNGLVYAPNAMADAGRSREDLQAAADMVRVGLAGTLRDYRLATSDGDEKSLWDIDYKGQPAGYASQPGEVVNYAENHDNQTLFDINAFKLPRDTSAEDRARVQMLGVAVTAFSQGVAYFHAGIDTLRSKSLDRNSFDSGDWFNRLDWTYRDNAFGTGLPPASDNAANWALMKPLLADASIKPGPREIALARDMFRDLLRIRASSRLFRLDDAGEVKQRLRFPNSGAGQNPLVVVGQLDGQARDGQAVEGAGFREILYLLNVSPQAQVLELPSEKGKSYRLHPVHRAAGAADPRPRRDARFERDLGRFTVPPRTTVVYVVE